MSWLASNWEWVLGAVMAGIEAYRYTKGSKAVKVFETAKEMHEAYRARQFDQALAEIGQVAAGVDPYLETLKKRSALGDAMLLARRPGATKAEIEAGRIARAKYEAGKL